MSLNEPGEPADTTPPAESVRRTIRLPFLYAGFVGFAVLAAWLASIGMGSVAPVALPKSLPVDRQPGPGPTTGSAVALPVAGSPTASAPAEPPAAAPPPTAAPSSTIPPAVANATRSTDASPGPSTSSTSAPSPVRTQVVVPDGPVVTIPTAGSDRSSSSSGDGSSSDTPSRVVAPKGKDS